MMPQGVALLSIFICFCILFMAPSNFVESTLSTREVKDSKSKITRVARTLPKSTSSIHRTNEITKPSQIRNKRSNLLSDTEQFFDNNAGLNSAFLYSDQIMQNLLKNQSPKPLNYARSNFYRNLLKPRTTRYNAWDDHSLMHFGKRSIEDYHNADKVVVKRSADSWSPNTVLHFGKKSSEVTNENNSVDDGSDIDNPNFERDEESKSQDTSSSASQIGDSDIVFEDNGIQKEETLNKKSADPWHSMMSFGKKSDPWHSMMSFGKKSDPWHSMMSFGKRSENPWDHSTLHFGKKDEPWHSMMSFGKKSDPWHNMMSFGKRSEDIWDHNTLHFGKRDDPWHNMMSFGKRDEPWHSMMSFGKKGEPWHNMMSFGKRDDPWHNMMSFGKRDEPWHNMMSFGKRDEPWHSMMSFGKRDEPWHSMMSFGKKSDNPWDHNTLHFGKRDDPWHNMMSFGKRSELSEMEDLEKRDDPWHNMMSFGKKSEDIRNNSSIFADKREEPWHNMMSFGKKSENPWDHSTLHFGKREEPWHNMMSFGKKSDYGFDHNTLHFGKRDEPWHNMMSFGKKSDNEFDHNTLHFGKRDEPWHNMMSFGKKSEGPWGEHNTLHFGKRDDPWHNMMSFGKRSGGLIEDDLLEDFRQHGNPWEEYNAMVFYKKSDPWDHNTLHFGKKSNGSLASTLSKQEVKDENLKHVQKRSVDMWNDHDTMHFGKKSEFENSVDVDKKFDWDSHDTMHFGKKRDPWDYHNTMHFGKKKDPWDYHNTMHFGKRNPWEHHNTMHFGKKRDPWDYNNKIHVSKRSDSKLKDENELSKKDIKDNDERSNMNDNRSTERYLKIKNFKNENKISLKKRSSGVSTSNLKLDVNHNNNYETQKITNQKNSKKSNDNQNYLKNRIIKRSLQTADPHKEKTFISSDTRSKIDYGITPVVNEEKITKPGTSTSNKKDDFIKDEAHTLENNSKSRINKRSVLSASLSKDINEQPRTGMFEEYSNDVSPDTLLYFGKRSTDYEDENDDQMGIPWFETSKAKKFDDYWDNHNTMHFGKKSDPWDGHSTLHFGKRYSPWDSSTMHFGKRDPWDYHNTLHFGKKFDPWEGHAQLHFGKRTSDWDHNVMHFGKRNKLTPEDLQNIRNPEELLALLFDPLKLKYLLEEKNSQQMIGNEQNKDFLGALEGLETIVQSHLKDDNIPFEEKLVLLKSYLKPILKAILIKQTPGDVVKNPFIYSERYPDGEIDNNDINDYSREETNFGNKRAITNYEDDLLPTDSEGINEDYDENLKAVDFLKAKNYLKTKRGYFGKPELKRYFIPFQGPKSIVYPHAWFASQIRRSSLPRTTELARNMEMRMAEKKEDPFNSYMHFGRR